MVKQKLPKLTVEDHLNNKPKYIVDLFNTLKNRISELGINNIQEKVTNPYIGYKFIDNKNKRPKLFVEVHLQQKKIELHLRPLDYNDMRVNKAPDTHRWTLNKLVDINNEADLNYVMKFVEQSYKDFL